MIGGVLYRVAKTCIGVLWPAYECYKHIEHDGKNLREWCMYWVLFALLSAAEPPADLFLFWLPFYTELKLLLVYYLAFMGGAETAYTTVVQPFLHENEAQVDKAIAKVKVWVNENVRKHTSRASATVSTKLMELLTQGADGAGSNDSSPRVGAYIASPTEPAVPVSTGSKRSWFTGSTNRGRKQG